MAEETEKKKFQISDGEVDQNELLDVIARNADSYAQWRLQKQPGRNALLKKNRQAAFNVDGFHSALQDITTAISEGKLKRGAGNVYIHSDGVVWEDPEHRAALDLVNRGISALSKTKSETKEKKKYSSSRIKDRFNNTFYGGNFTGSDSDWAIWKDNTHGISDLASMIQDEINDITNSDELDYEGSPYKNRQEHLDRLTKLHTNLTNGSLDESDVRDWIAIGGDGEFFRNVTHLKTTRENPYDTAWKEEEQKLLDLGYTPAQIAERKASWLEEQRDAQDPERWNRQYQKDFDNYVRTNWTGKTTTLANLGTDKYDLKEFDGVHNLDEGDEVKGFFEDEANVAYARNLLQKVIKGESIAGSKNGKNNNIILRHLMYRDPELNKSNYTQIGNNEFFINSTFDLKTGSAVKYNKKTRTFTRVHVDPQKTPKLLAKLKEIYKKQHPFQRPSTANSQFGSILQKGGKLNELRAIRKAQSGLSLSEATRQRKEAKYQETIQKEMDATGKSKDQVLIGHSRIGSTESHLKDRGVTAGLDNSDWLRLTSALTDLASIGVSYTGAGMPVAAGMQIGSTVMDLIADMGDDSVSGWDAAKNFGINLGLGAATAIGGGAVAKAGKIGRTVARLLPVAMTAYGATNLLSDPGFKKTMDKVEKGNFTKLTTNDMKNINAAIKIIAGGHHGIKSAAGALGTEYGKNSAVMRGLGKWGNNAYGNLSKAQAQFTTDPSKLTRYQRNVLEYNEAVNRGGFNPGDILGGAVTKKGQKYVIGDQEFTAAEYKRLNDVYKKAIKKPNATQDQVKAAVQAEFAKIKGLTPTTETITHGKTKIGDEAAIKAFFEDSNKPTGTNTIDMLIEGATDGSTKKALTAAQWEALKNAYGTGDLDALNAKYTELFPNTINTIQPTIPELAIPEFTSRGKYNPLRFLTRQGLEAKDPGTGILGRVRHAIYPERADRLDISTIAGRKNAKLLQDLRRYSGDDRMLSSNLEFNNGFGIFKTDITPQTQAMQAFRNKKIQEKAQRTQQEALQKLRQLRSQNKPTDDDIFAVMVAKTPELAGKTDKQIATYMRTVRQQLGVDDTVSNKDLLHMARVNAKQNGFSSVGDYLKSLGTARQGNQLSAFVRSSTGSSILNDIRNSGGVVTPGVIKNVYATYQATMKAAQSITGGALTTQQKSAIQQALISKSKNVGLSLHPKKSELSYKELSTILGKTSSAKNNPRIANPITLPSGLPTSPTSIVPQNISGIDVIDLRKHMVIGSKNVLNSDGSIKTTKNITTYSTAAQNFIDTLRREGVTAITDPAELADWARLLGVSTPKAIYEHNGKLILRKRGGKLDELKALRNTNFSTDNSYSFDGLSKFLNGGIMKFANPAQPITPDETAVPQEDVDWYTSLWSGNPNGILLNLERMRQNQNASFTSGANHNEASDLSIAAKKNNAYIGNPKHIQEDIQHFYNNKAKGYTAQAFVDYYNQLAQANRDFYNNRSDWQVNDTRYPSDVAQHNDDFKLLFNNRTNIDNNDNSYIGWDENLKSTYGTNTHMRRMDQYRDEFEDLVEKGYIPKIKERVHEITLGDGSKAYVYKKANGDIGIVDNDLLTQLNGNSGSKPEDTQTSGSQGDGGSGSSGDDGGLNKSKLVQPIDLINSFATKISPNRLALLRLARNLRNNRKLAELAKENDLALLYSKWKHRNTYGDFATLQSATRQGSEYNRRADEIANATTNQELGALAKLEAQMKDNSTVEYGKRVDNAKTDKTREASNAVANEVYDYNHKVSDENMARFVAKHNYNIGVDEGELSSRITNWNNYLMGLEKELKTNKVDDKNTAIAVAQNDLANFWEDNVINTASIQALKEKARALSGDSSKTSEYNATIRQIQKEQSDNVRKYNNIKREWTRRVLSGDYNWRPFINQTTGDFAIDRKDDYPLIIKKGAKIIVDSSKMKYRADDLKELRKQIKHNINTNQKALDNLSKATLLELKKMMGI